MALDTLSLLAIQALQSIVLFIVPPLIVARIRSRQPLEWLRLRGQGTAYDRTLVLLCIGVILTAVPLINCLVAWNEQLRLPASLSGLEQSMQQMEQQAERLLQAFMTYGNGAWWMLLLNLLVLAVLPAIGEELMFRGVIQTHLLKRLNSHVAIWLTAFVFSFVHFQFYGFVVRMVLGAVLGYVLVWTGRIGYSMLMHATNNALSVLMFYLGTYVWHLSPDELDAIGTQNTWWLTLLCTPLMLAQLYLIYRRTIVSPSNKQTS